MKNLIILYTPNLRAMLTAVALLSLGLASRPAIELKEPRTSAPEIDESVTPDSITSTSAYFILRQDLRRCASPLCGGFFVKLVNQSFTRCADGVLQSSCYVTSIDWNGQPELDAERALLRGTIEQKMFQNFGNLGTLRVTESWKAASARKAIGLFYRVRDLGVRCITHPCLSHKVAELNSTVDRNVAGVDLMSVGASGELVSRASNAMTESDGVLVRGTTTNVKGPAGTEKTLKATQFYLRVTKQQSAEPPGRDPRRPGKACIKTGCSNQICADEDVMSTCEWRAEYACYARARCERQPDGKCGFTQTPELTACLANPPKP